MKRAMIQIEQYPLSGYRLVDGLGSRLQKAGEPRHLYCKGGRDVHLVKEKKMSYIDAATVALTYFTTQGTVKEWFEDNKTAIYKNTMSWDFPL
jgi:hypothetical protein